MLPRAGFFVFSSISCFFCSLTLFLFAIFNSRLSLEISIWVYELPEPQPPAAATEPIITPASNPRQPRACTNHLRACHLRN